MPRGGARQGAGRKPFPEFKPEGIVIDARDCVAYVSRWQRVGPAFQLVEATNAGELEKQAEQEIRSVGGHVTMSGIYPCTPELAGLAVWEIDTMSIKVAFELITTDNLERIAPTDQRTVASQASGPWQHGEWFAYEDDAWQRKGCYLWLPDAGSIGICTNGDSQWADARNVQQGLDMYVNDYEAFEAAN